MNLSELHTALHPKFGPYRGPADEYSYTLAPDMALTLERMASGEWQFAVYERGALRETIKFESEATACVYLYKFAKE